MPRIIKIALATVLILVVAEEVVRYYNSFYSLVLVPAFFLAREIALRSGFILLRVMVRKILRFAIEPLIGPRWRRRLRFFLMRMGHRTRVLKRWSRRRWKGLPRSMRIVVGLGVFLCACIAVSLSWWAVYLLLFMPFKFEALSAAIAAIKVRAMPIALRFAAARGLDKLVPSVWRTMPQEVRVRVAPHTHRILWRSASLLVNSRNHTAVRVRMVVQKRSRFGLRRIRARYGQWE